MLPPLLSGDLPLIEVEGIVLANSIHRLLGRHPLVAASGRAKIPIIA
jgi:hypothetical protein